MKWWFFAPLLVLSCVAYAQVGPIPLQGTFINSVKVTCSGNTFFVSASGNDGNCGNSIFSPWKTIAKVNSSTFAAGSTVSLHGGDTFAGVLSVTTSTAPGPFTINSYGNGQAVINSAINVGCIHTLNIASITVTNLTCTGQGNLTSAAEGIFIFTNAISSRLSGASITSTTVSGYGDSCIVLLGGDESSTGNILSGYDNVTVSNNTAHDCTGHRSAGGTSVGIGAFGGFTSTRYNDFTNLNIASNIVFNIPGDGANGGGLGVGISNVTTGTVFNNVVHDGGTSASTCGGPVGVINYITDNITLSFNEIYNWTSAGCDGELMNPTGKNSLVEYNYLHGTANDAYVLFDTAVGSTSNIFRFNVIEASNGTNGIHLSIGLNASINDAVYNNTFYLVGQNAIEGGCAVGATAQNINISNNIFYSSAPALFFSLDPANCGTSSFPITGNDYYVASSPGTFSAKFSTTTFNTLATFQTSGFERLPGAINVGTTSSPVLTAPGSGVTCNGYFPPCPTAYSLQTSSTVKLAGLNLTNIYSGTASAVVLSLGTSDFYGNPITAVTLPIGADATSNTYLGPLDAVAGATACLSLRACSASIAAAASQSIINVRNTSTAETCDIGVATNGGFGNTKNCSGSSAGISPVTFCAGGGGFCAVKTFYDQSGNSNTVSQTVGAIQPTLSFSCQNGFPCMTFNNTHAMSNTSTLSAQPTTFSWVAERTGNSGAFGGVLNCGKNDGTSIEDTFSNSANTIESYAGTVVNLAGTFQENNWHSVSIVNSATTGISNVDGTTQTGENSGTNACSTTTTKGMIWGGDIANTNGLTGKASEGLIYSSGLSASSIAAICHNQRRYWATPGTC